MYVWVLTGLAFGILLSSLIRRLQHSSLGDITYITLLAVVDEWRRKRKTSGQNSAAESRLEEKEMRAAASRFTLL